MSTQPHAAALAVLALGFAFAPCASAALWSSTNTVAKMSEMATMEIVLTGDQITIGTQVDITVPSGITNITVTPLNGAGCAYLAASRTVRVIAVDAMLNPLPLWARPMCTVQYRVFSRGASTWFPMHGAGCYTVEGEPIPTGQCAIDEGYLTFRR